MELSDKKRKDLLNFWFYYYGKVICTLKEYETFHNLLDCNLDGVEKVAVVNFINNEGSSLLVLAIRAGKELELIDTLNFANEDDDPTKKESFVKITEAFYTMVLDAYNKPEPAIPMDKEVIIQQVCDIASRNRNKKEERKN